MWAVALGSSIGWGAFVQPTDWMSTAGPLGASLGLAIGGLLMMLIAVSYGFLIRSFPVSGGEFAYAFISLGKTHAFISGWFLTLGYICIVALNASALALMMRFVFPSLLENLYMYEVAGGDVYGVEIMVATVALAIFGYLNVRGGVFSGKAQFIFCVIMIIGIVLISVLVGAQPSTGLENASPSFPSGTNAGAAIVSIIAISPWAFVGFDNVPQAAEEFNFSSKKAFGLIIFAIAAAVILYGMMIFSVAISTPWQNLTAADNVWETGFAIKELLGNVGLLIVMVALTMGIITGLNGFIISTSRLLFAMSRAKFIPKAFSKLHKKYETPYISIIFTVLIAMIAPWFGRNVLGWVVDMSSVGVTIAYFYTCYTAFSLFKWRKDQQYNKGYYVISPMRKALAGLGVIVSVIFLGLLIVPGSPAYLEVQSRIALVIWIVMGIIFYLVKRKDYKKVSDKEMSYLILGKEDIFTETKTNRKKL
ncbi:amino acid permease [Alicyclobacillus contaminans]|uniref:Amino acid permease n=1 Tax=Tetragenococcus osmophilus TaxID=526944 RepID=A0AA38CVC7_9ENTE|nr:APC family permease [Tetragenococcus osmophilus]GMA55210.1 amino acid permease [Alicyclobacillus contaminans]GMA71021.1 amino acid permease [Tetragenococcus osmophilus]